MIWIGTEEVMASETSKDGFVRLSHMLASLVSLAMIRLPIAATVRTSWGITLWEMRLEISTGDLRF